MSKLLLFLIINMGMQLVEIDEQILDRNFSEYRNNYFIEIDQNTSYDYGISYHYNYYYSDQSPTSFKYIKHTVKKAAFAVRKEESSIEQVIIYLEIFDIDMFYEKLVNKYGTPATLSLSKKYIEEHGFSIPPEMENFSQDSYDGLPKPQIDDYKNLRNISWYNVNNTTGTNITVRNNLTNKIMDIETYEVQVIFKKSK